MKSLVSAPARSQHKRKGRVRSKPKAVRQAQCCAKLSRSVAGCHD